MTVDLKDIVLQAPMICPVCGKEPNGRSIGDTQRLLELLSMKVRVNWKMCEKDQKLLDEGFLAVVEAKVPEQTDKLIPPGDAVRTGKVVHVKRDIAEWFFDQEIDPKFPLVFAEPNVIEMIEAKMKKKESKDG